MRKRIIRKCINCGKEIIRKKFKRINVYCNNKCQHEYQTNAFIDAWKAGLINPTGITISQSIRNYLLNKFDNKCSVCGWNKVNEFTHRICLEVEHIDGNYLNNKEENLTILCPNCHSLTSTYKGANKGKGRKSRK